MTENAAMPAAGTKAPDFTLPDGQGKPVHLKGLKGKPVVVYFYPKDNTPGCTTEATGFQANMDAFRQRGAVVLGISPDNAASHCKFADKYGIEFQLLADEHHQAAEKYGVWVEKNRAGKTYMGIQRATFLIDPAGKVAAVWPKVKPDGHAQDVLEQLDALR
ncbi:MAG: thioredoxin-dependent thiol peroxidase [Candidatus Hydrogenedentota bacterium]